MEILQEYVQRGPDRIGLQIYPAPASDAPMVVIMPAMGVPARYYRPFAADLHAAGLAVAVADLRGTGASTPAPAAGSAYGYADLVDDVGAVLDALKPHLDGRRRILLGHSLGGQISTLHLALHAAEPPVDALALIAVGIPYWRLYTGPYAHGVRHLSRLMVAVSRVARYWPGWGFGGRQSRGVIRDWAHTVRTGRFPALRGTDPEPLLAGITLPILAVTLDTDQYTPHQTLDHLCAKLTGARISRGYYTAADSGAPMNHFTWVRAAAPLAARVADFAAGLPAQD